MISTRQGRQRLQSPGAVFKDGYDKEVEFRQDLVEFFKGNPEIKSRIVDENGVIDKNIEDTEVSDLKVDENGLYTYSKS